MIKLFLGCFKTMDKKIKERSFACWEIGNNLKGYGDSSKKCRASSVANCTFLKDSAQFRSQS